MWIIVMFLSTVWTLILTAPIHCCIVVGSLTNAFVSCCVSAKYISVILLCVLLNFFPVVAEYLEVVWRSLAAENPECPLVVKKASDTLVERLNDPKTYDNITKDFR